MLGRGCRSRAWCQHLILPVTAWTGGEMDRAAGQKSESEAEAERARALSPLLLLEVAVAMAHHPRAVDVHILPIHQPYRRGRGCFRLRGSCSRCVGRLQPASVAGRCFG